MRPHIAPMLVLLAGSLAGCAVLSGMNGDVKARVEEHESREEYGLAIDALAAVPREHPDYKRLMQKRAHLETKARAYEQSAIRRAGELTAQNRWSDALALYREALNKLPRSQALREELQAFRQKQAQRGEELRVELLVSKARWLERSLPLQEALAKTDPDDDDARRALDARRAEAATLAEELNAIGLAALEKDNLGVAARTLPLAARLNPTPTAEQAKDRLSRAELDELRRQRRTQERAIGELRQRETRQLLTEYNDASRAGDLRRARQAMARLQELDAENPEVVREHEKLRGKIERAVQKDLDEAINLYSHGKFEEAIVRWNRVLELDPENEKARSNLERAGRVVEKLRQLREKQASDPKGSAE